MELCPGMLTPQLQLVELVDRNVQCTDSCCRQTILFDIIREDAPFTFQTLQEHAKELIRDWHGHFHPADRAISINQLEIDVFWYHTPNLHFRMSLLDPFLLIDLLNCLLYTHKDTFWIRLTYDIDVLIP